MPDAKRTHKLSEDQQRQVLTWLGEGRSDTEIAGLLEERFGITISGNGVKYYRKPYAKEIAECAEDVYLASIQEGFGNKAQRIEVLKRNAAIAAGLTVAGGKGWTQMSAELRAILKDIRDELGDLKQRHEHTGPGGGAVEVQHGGDAIDRLEGLLAGIAARSAEGGGAGATDAD